MNKVEETKSIEVENLNILKDEDVFCTFAVS